MPTHPPLDGFRMKRKAGSLRYPGLEADRDCFNLAFPLYHTATALPWTDAPFAILVWYTSSLQPTTLRTPPPCLALGLPPLEGALPRRTLLCERGVVPVSRRPFWRVQALNKFLLHGPVQFGTLLPRREPPTRPG